MPITVLGEKDPNSLLKDIANIENIEFPTQHKTELPTQHKTELPSQHMPELPSQHMTELPSQHKSVLPTQHKPPLPTEVNLATDCEAENNGSSNGEGIQMEHVNVMYICQ